MLFLNLKSIYLYFAGVYLLSCLTPLFDSVADNIHLGRIILNNVFEKGLLTIPDIPHFELISGCSLVLLVLMLRCGLLRCW